MATVDLDAKRAARAEAQRTPHELVFGGETFQVPARMPLEVLDLMTDGKMRAAFELLLGGEDETTRFFAHRPDDLDLAALMEIYNPDGDAGELSASAASLPNTGRRSRPISKATTTSTSPTPATANSSSAPGSS